MGSTSQRLKVEVAHLLRPFLWENIMEHLKEAGETYWEHLSFAFSVGFVMIVHGLMPWVWEYKATEMMAKRDLERRERTRRSVAGYE